MSQFKYLNEMNSLLNFDGPLTNGPVPRWERKRLENSTSLANASLNSSKNKSVTVNDSLRLKKTPRKTPCKSKSPCRSGTPTPNKNSKTPTIDRFIPSRSATNFDLGYYKLNQVENEMTARAKRCSNKPCAKIYADAT